jgi:hypothetical protein
MASLKLSSSADLPLTALLGRTIEARPDLKVKAMVKSVFPSVALAIALGFVAPSVAFADTTEPAVHQHVVAPHKAHMSRKERLRIEGLRRNPDDCVKYGCVGNN